MNEWTEDDIRRFLDVAKGTVYYPAYLLGIFCGLRRGEILGITWNEIDFTKKKLVVLKVLSTDGKTIIMKPKTKGSRRNVDIPTEILMDRYSHLIPSLQSEAAESLNYLWGK